jgi:hypothetical protein
MMPDDDAVLGAWRGPAAAGIDLREEALTSAGQAAGISVLPGGRRSRAAVVLRGASQVEVRAEGPGLLVIAESWDAGFTVETDGRPAPLLRVNHALMGTPLEPGVHRIVLRHRPPGFAPGLALAAASALGIAFLLTRRS